MSEDNTTLKPTRESQRLRKCPNVLCYNSFEDYGWQWSERDKALFLAGCSEVGIENIEGLKRFLPHKSKHEIQSQIEMWKGYTARNITQKLSKRQYKKVSNLDDWLSYFSDKTKSDTSTFAMSNIFLLISEYGKFPSLEECSGIDIRAMYRYIHCMMNGIPPYGINKLTSKILLSCINNVLDKLNEPVVKETYEDHLFSIKVQSEEMKRRFGKTYSRKRKHTSVVQKILSNPTMNPLNLSMEAISEYPFEEEEEESSDE